MIAKVIASAETRNLAIARLAAALRTFPILGVRTNVPFLLRILEHPLYNAGRIDTGFLDREGAALASSPEDIPEFVRAVAAAHDDQPRATSRESRHKWDPWQT
jgi:acetyl/propionyl-CoA carboxylase alpha subunit